MSIELKSPREVAALRVAGKMAAETLMLVGDRLRVGMTTDEIDRIVHEDTVRRGARPAPLNYKGFPKSVCTSVNHVVCHGIPGSYALRDGDIVNVDVTTVAEGMHGDTSATFYVGAPSADARRVTEAARQALQVGMSVVKDGARVGDIGAAIQEYIEGLGQGFGIVRDYCGHGTGRRFHEEPSVAHYRQGRDERNARVRMKAGMVFTVEPMINLGTHEVETLGDRWTVVTADRKLSAQFEHTLLVTRAGYEVLTARDGVLRSSEGVVGVSA
ncbi:MAG: type I methionyl aminopeptidase [Polyangiaceae bacterium]|nr:type I methionyl aminopeptidase [Polyangiaceae bacterium]